MGKTKLNKNIYLFLSINLIASFSMGIFNTFLGIYLKEVGYQESFVGSILSINTFFIAIASIPSAYLIEKIGRKKSFTLGFILISLGSSLIVIFESTLLITLMAIINGFGMSIKSTAEGMYITENTTEAQRVNTFSLNFIVSNIGMMGASFIGGMASTYLGGMYSSKEAIMVIFIVSAVMSICALLPIAFMKEKESLNPRDFKACLKGYKTILNKNIAIFMSYNFLIGCGAGMVVPFFSVYLKYSMDISDGLVGSILSFSQVGCIVGGMLIPIIASKIGRERAVVTSQLLSIPFLISIAFPQGIPFVAICFFMRNGLMNMASPLVQNIAMEMVDEENRTNLSSVMSLSSNISRALGISIGGFMMERISYNSPYYLTIILYGVAIIMFCYIFKERITPHKNKLQKQH